MKPLTPKQIVEKFKRKPSNFSRVLEKEGFHYLSSGAYSSVYTHEKSKWVVKISGCEFSLPERKSKYFLKPKKIVCVRRGESGRIREYNLMIQRKVITRKSHPDDYNWYALTRKVANKCKMWWDDHTGNIGVLDGKPVIIDW